MEEFSKKDFEKAHEMAISVIDNVGLVIRDKRDKIMLVFAAMLAEGHILLEDVPGTAKTILCRSIGASISSKHRSIVGRIQGTPDLYPMDIIGNNVYTKERERKLVKGPVLLSHFVLFDEVNRAMPRTQSAMLESMGEKQVTIGEKTHDVLKPFWVLATQNPIDQEGTNPLPEAQLDRFIIRDTLGYPGLDATKEIVIAQRHGHPLADLEAVIELTDMVWMQEVVEYVSVEDSVLDWIVRVIVRTQALSTGENPKLILAASPRGALALDKMARARALLRGRNYVTEEDVRKLLVPVLGHRLILEQKTLKELGFSMQTNEAVVEFLKKEVLPQAPYRK